MFKFPWQTKSVQTIEKKSGTTVPPYMTRAGLFEHFGSYDLSFFAINKYYKSCAPLADSVDTIAKDVAEIDPIVYDTKNDEYVEHDVLELLENPNTSQTYEDFMIELAATYLITDNAFLESIGNVSRPPLSIQTRSPMHSTLMPDNVGDLGKIIIHTNFLHNIYRAETINRKSRYYSDGDKEMWPILGFNPDKGGDKFYGTPKIRSLYYEIEQYIAAGQHNTSLLKNGARPGGVLTAKNETPLTEAQHAAAQNQIDEFYSGAGNAGRVMLMEWFEYKDMIVSNRDMDFKTLRDGARESIYLRYNIPLPMVFAGSMTYSNYETAQVGEYQNAVIPLLKYLLKQITLATMYRYNPKEPKRFIITIDETKIGALAPVRTKTIETLKNISVNTVNELRVSLGYDKIPEGDVILRPANEIPAMDGDTDTDIDTDDEDLKNQLLNAVNSKGERMLSDEEVSRMSRR